MSEGALAGIGVLVTRPRHQAAELAAAIEAEGGVPILFPALEILARPDADVAADIGKLASPDIAIFVSPNAVRFGFAHAGSAAVAAIGPATAAAIDAAGGNVDIVSAAGYDSEHLLAEPALKDVDGKVVRIIRGQRGRELLAETLRSRGATVDFLAVYERTLPSYPANEIVAIEEQWRAGHIATVTVMSAESLHNLVELLPDTCIDMLTETPLVTPAPRVIKEADDLLPGIPTTLADSTRPADMVLAIADLGLDVPGHT